MKRKTFKLIGFAVLVLLGVVAMLMYCDIMAIINETMAEQADSLLEQLLR